MYIKRTFSSSLSICLLIIIFILLFTSNIEAFDEKIQMSIQENRNQVMDDLMDSVTHLGDGIITGGIALSIQDNQLREHAWKSQLVNSLATIFFKITIGRERPSSNNLDSNNYKPFQLDNNYHSMPSGHTSAAFALATSISENYPEYRKVAYSLASIVAFSRLYRNDHWASDVIVGAGVGYLSAKLVSYHW